MKIMSFRYQELKATIAGFEETGVGLISNGPSPGYEGDFVYTAAGYSDNVGIYYAIPWIVRTFHVSLDLAINLLFYGVLGTGFVCAAVGLTVLFKTATQRTIALAQLGVLLYFAIRLMADVYVFGISVTVALVPWALVLLKKDARRWVTLLFCVVAGVCVGATHYFRVHAATAVAILILVYLLLDSSRRWTQKSLFAAALCGGAMVPIAWFEHLAEQRDSFLATASPEYYAHTKSAYGPCASWHSIYIGFGFLNNQYGIRYRDEDAIARVQSEAPDAVYLSSEYVSVLKNAVFDLFRNDRVFVFSTLTAKSGVLAFYFAVFANLGLFATWLRPISRQTTYAFVAAGLFSALPGILVMPLPHYVSSLLALGTLFGVVCLNDFVGERSRRQLWVDVFDRLRRGPEAQDVDEGPVTIPLESQIRLKRLV